MEHSTGFRILVPATTDTLGVLEVAPVLVLVHVVEAALVLGVVDVDLTGF